MAARNNDFFTTIRTEGALLPPDLLRRIADGDSTLDGLRPTDYHLSGERLNEAINRAWNSLQGAWSAFKTARENLAPGDLGTTITRERWLLPLFRELDYGRLQTATAVEIDGRSYPISHRWGNVPIHLVSYQIDLDKRTPGVAGAATTSPHSLMQVFLNRSDDHLWGFVSNGLRLRILRDNVSLTRQAYVEFDLEAMMDGEIYADFVLLWLLCHQSRVEGERPSDCWLEKWMKAAEEQGTRALDQLRDGVERAINALGAGFITHPANRALRERLQSGALDKQEYYRQLLRLVYRLLILFVAEDRGLLYDPNSTEAARALYVESYSTQRLRRIAERMRGTQHADLYESLRLVMRLLGGEAPIPGSSPTASQGLRAGEGKPASSGSKVPPPEGEGFRVGAATLGLPVLGSFLFSDEAVADIIDCQIANADLLEAVRAIGFVEDKSVRKLRQIDYKNLGPEELGSVYESLLELHPQINIPARTFALATAGGNERKTTGSYYTPTSLISVLLDSALDPLIAEAVKGDGKAPIPGPSPTASQDLRAGEGKPASSGSKVPPPEGERFRVGATTTAEERLLNLKVCDPACGSGHFLIAAAHRIARALASVRTGDEEPSPEATRQALRDVIGRCIYGVDINPMAVELCKVNLWLEALEPGKPLSFLEHRIKQGNSLLGTTPALMAQGIPDDAFNPIEGDDKAVVSKYKKQNREERRQREAGVYQQSLFAAPPADYARLSAGIAALDALDDDTLDGIREKEARYRKLAEDEEYQKARGLADAWCAAFVWEKAATAPIPSPSPTASQGLRAWGRESQEASLKVPPPEGEGFRVGAAPPPMTDLLYRRLEQDPLAPALADVRAYIARLKEQYSFFHWHVEFPDVFHVPDDPAQAENEQTGWSGGFSCVLGNPPWERIKIQEKEWFAERAPEIAAAPNTAARRRMIAALEKDNPALLAAFNADKRQAKGESHFVRVSGRYPLCGRGDVNTYTIFAESSRQIVDAAGHVGMIVPSGIATDDTTKFFFQDLMESRSLVSLYDFENREGLFPAVASLMKFCLLTMAGPARPVKRGAEFVFFALNVGDLDDKEKRFTLSAEDIALLNPNTRTCATFRSRRDAELTKAIYRRVPVLIKEGPPEENPWGISFLRMFDMSNDSHLFRTREQLEAQGYRLVGNRFVAPTLNPSPSGGGTSETSSYIADSTSDSLPPEGEGPGMGASVYLPLYEAKMMHQFDHRWATYDGADTRNLTSDEKRDPTCLPLPRYWVDEREVEERIGSTPYMIGFRDIARATDERTAIATAIPRAAVGHTMPIIILNRRIGQFFPFLLSEGEGTLQGDGALTANLCSFVFDYVARQKLGGTHLTFFILRQLPVLSPSQYSQQVLEFTNSRVLELFHTSHDLQPFARDLGYDGPPFVWNDERRFIMRCELDALYFHLYGIERDDVDYIMDTFPIVRRKDEAAYGEYRTKRTILEMYDEMAALGVHEDPDCIARYVSRLDPPPGDIRAAHKVE